MKVRKILGYTCGILCAASALLEWELYAYYGKTRPTGPQPSLGRTVPLNNHGAIVFLTAGENDLLTAAFFGQLLFWIPGALLLADDYRWRRGRSNEMRL
jgi:hypothetical protein